MEAIGWCVYVVLVVTGYGGFISHTARFLMYLVHGQKKKSLTSFHIGFDRCLSSIDEQIQSNSNLSNHLCIAYLYDMRLFLTLSLFTLSQVAGAPTASRTMQASAQTKWVKCKQPKKKIWLEWMHEKKRSVRYRKLCGAREKIKMAFIRFPAIFVVNTCQTTCRYTFNRMPSSLR